MNTQEHKFQSQRYRMFEQTVIAPAIYERIEPFKIEYAASKSSSPADAAKLAYENVGVGFRWGPAWSRAWFRLSAPAIGGDIDGLVGRFDCGTEALVYTAESPWQGLDANRSSFQITKAIRQRDGSLCAYVHAECMHPWGVKAFSWDTTETHRRWESDDPGHVTLAEIARFDERVWQLWCAYRFATQLFVESGPGTALSRLLHRALDAATGAVKDTDVPSSAQSACDILHEAISAGSPAESSRVIAVGHAHIDTAWLWTLEHTRRKCQRSWSNAVRLLEKTNDFRFVCSQAAQYQMVEQDAPELSMAVDAFVKKGQWEPIGCMWVEPDCNVPSGESLIRQIAEARAYFEERFESDFDTRTCFLPDTFGFPASLPGILHACGIDTFITNKLSWNQTNAMPHTSFLWRGIDGAEILAHLTPGGDYNATNTPRELLVGEKRAATTSASGFWLQPFGFGDGGGGPTDWQIENARFANKCPGLPSVHLGSYRDFVNDLHYEAAKASDSRQPWSIWDGELYLELHRGTLTTQAELKRLNAACEQALREAEIATVLTENIEADHDARRSLWRDLLLNQFHDILPGSSIHEVNKEASAQLEQVLAESRRMTLSAFNDADKETNAAHVFNPSSYPASGVLETETGLAYVENVPALSVHVIEPMSPVRAVTCNSNMLENEHLIVKIGEHGAIESLVHQGNASAQHAAHPPLHMYKMYRDRPHMWDAWDIDPGYEADDIELEHHVTVESDGNSDLRRTIKAIHKITEQSSISTRYTLDAGARYLTIEMNIDWQESHRLLRVEYPTSIKASHATYGIQFGTVDRPTHRNTPWDVAKFEVPGHRFVNVSMPGKGLALLSESTYGFSCVGSTIGASLLRSPTHPDPESDRGTHSFRFGLMPHQGDFRAAEVCRVAEQFVRPLRSISAARPFTGPTMETKGRGSIEISAMKPAETPGAIIIRLVELQGGSADVRLKLPWKIKKIERTDAIEREVHDQITLDEPIHMNPYEILTLRAWLKN